MARNDLLEKLRQIAEARTEFRHAGEFTAQAPHARTAFDSDRR
jgi:predicted RNA polymerase sigma factor